MSSQWLCTIAHTSLDGVGYDHTYDAMSAADYALDHMASEMNSWSSTDFTPYRPSSVLQTDPGLRRNSEAEDSFIYSCLSEIADLGIAVPGDTWLIVDLVEGFGYGGSRQSYTLDSGGKIFGDRVLYTPGATWAWDPIEVFHNFTIHEMAHCFRASHRQSNYSINWSGEVSNITPMGTSYTYLEGGDPDNTKPNEYVDTHHPGSGDWYDDLCHGRSNFLLDEFCGPKGDSCRHTKDMSTCTKDQIDAEAPL